jgi:alkylation response protein AidB-like acyl-CoA dehydrogenase
MISQGLKCDLEIAVAKSWTGDVYRRITAMSHQIHGAIGFTMDYNLHFYSRRAKAAEVTFGDADFWQETIARGIGLS